MQTNQNWTSRHCLEAQFDQKPKKSIKFAPPVKCLLISVSASTWSGADPATCIKRRSRLDVRRVGAGGAPRDERAELPTAIQFQDEPATLATFGANIATGSGAELGAILGSESTQLEPASPDESVSPSQWSKNPQKSH